MVFIYYSYGKIVVFLRGIFVFVISAVNVLFLRFFHRANGNSQAQISIQWHMQMESCRCTKNQHLQNEIMKHQSMNASKFAREQRYRTEEEQNKHFNWFHSRFSPVIFVLKSKVMSFWWVASKKCQYWKRAICKQTKCALIRLQSDEYIFYRFWFQLMQSDIKHTKFSIGISSNYSFNWLKLQMQWIKKKKTKKLLMMCENGKSQRAYRWNM